MRISLSRRSVNNAMCQVINKMINTGALACRVGKMAMTMYSDFVVRFMWVNVQMNEGDLSSQHDSSPCCPLDCCFSAFKSFIRLSRLAIS